MIRKEYLDTILLPVEKLLKKGARWEDVVSAGIVASQQLQSSIEFKSSGYQSGQPEINSPSLLEK